LRLTLLAKWKQIHGGAGKRTDSGEVFLKHIPSARYPKVSFEEQRLLGLARRKAEESGDAALFD
jgi:hypothetical protein